VWYTIIRVRSAATIVDIAKACNVTRWTVSAILFPSDKNRHHGFSEETRALVQATAKRLRYRPNRGSRHLLNQEHGAIGILTSNFFNVSWHSIHAMVTAADRHGQVICFETIPGHEALPRFVSENVVQGLIVFDSIPDHVEQAILHHRIPAVFVNACRHQPNSLNMDEAGAIEQAVALLSARGRRKPTLLVGKGDAPYEQERISAMRKSCRREKMLCDVYHEDPFLEDPALRRQQLADYLAATPDCDAMLAKLGGQIAMLFNICATQGRRIPQDLSLICMQDPEILREFRPEVSGFLLPEFELGHQAVEMLNRIIAGKGPVPEIRLEYSFNARKSQ
jgi:LacI family transcriptional regulator